MFGNKSGLGEEAYISLALDVNETTNGGKEMSAKENTEGSVPSYRKSNIFVFFSFCER